MRLVRYESHGSTHVGVKSGDRVIPTGYTGLVDFIRDGERALQMSRDAIEHGEAVTDFRLLSPIGSPEKILCSGINYANHKEENPKAVFPKSPSMFSKLPSSVIGPEDSIIIPYTGCQLDYEVELTVVIGKRAKSIHKANAFDYVFGYTVMNDISARDLQFELQHETLGKGADSFCPLGPEIVLKDEIPDPSQLWVSSFVNGERRQHASTSGMLFDIPTLMEQITKYVTLNAGDLVSTGTPAGVGAFQNPPSYLKPGDEVIVQVDRIGELRNRVVEMGSGGEIQVR